MSAMKEAKNAIKFKMETSRELIAMYVIDQSTSNKMGDSVFMCMISDVHNEIGFSIPICKDGNDRLYFVINIDRLRLERKTKITGAIFFSMMNSKDFISRKKCHE